MLIALIFDTDRHSFAGRPRVTRTLSGYVWAWLWFEVRCTK